MRSFSLLAVLFCCSTYVLADVPVAMNCPDGWKWFKRSRGGWCMKVYSGSMNNAAAEAKCQAEGATIAGVQNNEEIAWMGTAIQAITGTRDTLWIGAKRTKLCQTAKLTQECSATSSFYWTDKSTVGVQGFVWQQGEPNNGQAGQDCIQLVTKDSNMDDLGCSAVCMGYVCGKIATF